MILISGIGNNEKKYENTRHNASYEFLKVLKAQLKEGGFYLDDGKWDYKPKKGCDSEILEFRWGAPTEIVLSRNFGYMNNSGVSVKKLIDTFNIDLKNFILVHDDLDIPLGEYKIQKAKSPHGHNGVKSVEEMLGTNDFWRVRIGIENREDKDQIPGDKYVLQKFTPIEKDLLLGTCIEASENLLNRKLFHNWL